jgi:dihydrodipicolinate synthase/N-acetylneuraminate lyase
MEASARFYNLVPELFVEVHTLAKAGHWDEARAVQARINKLIGLTIRYPCFPAVKTILRWSGIDCGSCLEPRRALTGEEKRGLREALKASSFAHLAG